jgi:hypothetical protein
MPPASKTKLSAASFRLERRSADEYMLWYGNGTGSVYCGHITYDPRYGWDAYNILDHKYLPSGPYGEGKVGRENAEKALMRAIMRRGHLTDGWQA